MSTNAFPPHGSVDGAGVGGGGTGQEKASHPRATLVFVLGLVSVLGCSLLGPVAWIMGNGARKEMRNSPGVYRDDSLLKAGWILGIIGTVLLAVAAVVVGAVAALGLFAANEVREQERIVEQQSQDLVLRQQWEAACNDPNHPVYQGYQCTDIDFNVEQQIPVPSQ